jgi:cytoskeletal protein CcmA (bactofilin family)
LSIPVSQIVNTQSFGTWLIRTNQMAQLFSQNTVTIDGSLTGSVSSGNSAVNGYFSATFLSANTIQGGSVGNTSNLAISTNTNFQVNGANVLSTFGNSTSTTVLINSNNFVVNNGTTIIGNVVFANTLSVNGNIYSNTNISVGNTFNANTTSVNFGSNLSANTSTLFVGNSTIFTNINSTSHNITNPTSNIQLIQ